MTNNIKMMHKLIFFLIMVLNLIIPGFVSGQITLSSNNYPVGGLTIMRGYCLAVPNVLGTAGPNQFYNFTNITPLYHDTIKYYSASSTPWASFHPGATVADAVSSGGIITVNYYTASPAAFRKTGLTMIGDFSQGMDTVHGNFSPVDTIIGNDYTYGFTDTEHAVGTILNFVPLGIYKTHTVRNISVDGWGQLQTPVNYYGDVLRIKYREFRRDTAYYLGTPVYTYADTLYYFKFYAKDIRHPVVTAYTDSSYNLQYFEYIFSPPVIHGCMDTMAQNYDPLANQSDGSCVYCNVNYSITPDTVICPGGTVNLNVFGGTSYLWYDGTTSSSMNVSPPQTTHYSVYVTNAPHCHALATVTVTVDQPVSSEFWTTQVTYGTGENIQFVNLSSNATYYLWDFDDSVNGTSNLEFPLHTYSAVGTKEVLLISGNTCFSDTAQHTLNIISSASVEDVVVANSFRIFPNPGYDHLMIEGNAENNAAVEVFAYDVLGRQVLVAKQELLSNPFRIMANMSFLPAGTYVIEIRTGEVSVRNKWIKL
jgi:hypothetical protein